MCADIQVSSCMWHASCTVCKLCLWLKSVTNICKKKNENLESYETWRQQVKYFWATARLISFDMGHVCQCKMFGAHWTHCTVLCTLWIIGHLVILDWTVNSKPHHSMSAQALSAESTTNCALVHSMHYRRSPRYLINLMQLVSSRSATHSLRFSSRPTD